jgi:hypothetical protein
MLICYTNFPRKSESFVDYRKELCLPTIAASFIMLEEAAEDT